MAIARPTTSAVDDEVAQQAGDDVPDQHRAPRIGIVRKRSMTPVTLSVHTPTAVPAAPNIAHSTTIPGTT